MDHLPASKVIRFGLSGLAATVAYLVIAILLSAVLPGRETLVSVFAYCCCIAISYLLQKYYTFRVRGRVPFERSRFVAASLFGLLLSTLIVHATTRWLGWSSMAAYLAVVATIPLLSYLLFSRFVFESSRSD